MILLGGDDDNARTFVFSLSPLLAIVYPHFTVWFFTVVHDINHTGSNTDEKQCYGKFSIVNS